MNIEEKKFKAFKTSRFPEGMITYKGICNAIWDQKHIRIKEEEIVYIIRHQDELEKQFKSERDKRLEELNGGSLK